MLGKLAISSVVIALGLMGAAPVSAAAPASGVVVEGHSVPGAALGSTRADIEATWGQPSHCHDVELSGDQAHCTFPIDGGGAVSAEFRGADGRQATGSPDDVTYEFSWGYGTLLLSPIDWTTTAGIDAQLALTDRQAVADAYPNAQVSRDASGVISAVADAALGIRFGWSYDSYTMSTGVRIYVNSPRAARPADDDVMAVTLLELSATKERGVRHVLAVVRVQDEYELPVEGASLSITWTEPNGNTATSSLFNLTSETGYDFFEINRAAHGTWTFTVNDVVADGFSLDRAHSTLSASVRVK